MEGEVTQSEATIIIGIVLFQLLSVPALMYFTWGALIVARLHIIVPIIKYSAQTTYHQAAGNGNRWETVPTVILTKEYSIKSQIKIMATSLPAI
ncbi:hypothetical protein COY59_01705 [Candidatus Gottesmanbacteria bacterium CG_4_10_14_0_8_um_filter_37_24]|uniref:Uncharacterized protein n=1 Tax=Candidatus Gottesmanbacteria bacterium CG_4_10_14_0_8_um_filter_37_24 TaxID=1974574 RepID=A0A2M7RSR6_9BACT|nr:MAG: hypothetical protein COY59_01705 [Candidatus Gottesmanbacteria bacterium CG_4_10_14_0_8_um_filter_37_24]